MHNRRYDEFSDSVLSFVLQVAFIVLLEHILLGARRVIDWAVPDVPEWVSGSVAVF